MLKLMIVVASTRPGRVGLPVAEWFRQAAQDSDSFEIDFADLAEIKLPFLDEPNHPRLRQYQHEHTKAWSRRVDSADAFVFVTPEYNYGMPATLLNALDFLAHEWMYKPVGFVSYGGVSGGTRSVQMAKLVITSLKLVPLPEAVNIPFVTQFLKEGRLEANEITATAADTMLKELARVAEALAPLRAKAA
ncbi:MAG: NAD(P)H-dependent oxidoreductase [Candidatus Dormibacteraeota bacterium]|nr:NAD(P)H-dependent oxidoreductase [Candidatus Dormibacteraeota bacterium]